MRARGLSGGRATAAFSRSSQVQLSVGSASPLRQARPAPLFPSRVRTEHSTRCTHLLYFAMAWILTLSSDHFAAAGRSCCRWRAPLRAQR